jgi:hypothetical protein
MSSNRLVSNSAIYGSRSEYRPIANDYGEEFDSASLFWEIPSSTTAPQPPPIEYNQYSEKSSDENFDPTAGLSWAVPEPTTSTPLGQNFLPPSPGSQPEQKWSNPPPQPIAPIQWAAPPPPASQPEPELKWSSPPPPPPPQPIAPMPLQWAAPPASQPSPPVQPIAPTPLQWAAPPASQPSPPVQPIAPIPLKWAAPPPPASQPEPELKWSSPPSPPPPPPQPIAPMPLQWAAAAPSSSGSSSTSSYKSSTSTNSGGSITFMRPANSSGFGSSFGAVRPVICMSFFFTSFHMSNKFCLIKISFYCFSNRGSETFARHWNNHATRYFFRSS